MAGTTLASGRLATALRFALAALASVSGFYLAMFLTLPFYALIPEPDYDQPAGWASWAQAALITGFGPGIAGFLVVVLPALVMRPPQRFRVALLAYACGFAVACWFSIESPDSGLLLGLVTSTLGGGLGALCVKHLLAHA